MFVCSDLSLSLFEMCSQSLIKLSSLVFGGNPNHVLNCMSLMKGKVDDRVRMIVLVYLCLCACVFVCGVLDPTYVVFLRASCSQIFLSLSRLRIPSDGINYFIEDDPSSRMKHLCFRIQNLHCIVTCMA